LYDARSIQYSASIPKSLPLRIVRCI